MKKLLVILMTAIMVMTFSVPAAVSAAESGSITINGVSDDNTYSIYKLLDLYSYDKDNELYSYTVAPEWAEFFDTAEAQNYFAVDEHDYVTWIATEDDATIAEFAKGALSYAKAKEIDPVKSSAVSGDMTMLNETTGKFDGLELGYYLIDSTVGALCGLTTTDPDAAINAKNGEPTVVKQVQEDSTNNWGKTNTADIEQTVNFRTTITVHKGAENYVLHDKMSEGLTFVKVEKIEHVVPGGVTHVAAADKYTVVETGLTDGCTFEVKFSKEFCDEMETNDKVIVYYSAAVNEKAVVAGDGNPNETWLDFGEGNYTTHDKTQTYVYGFDIIKTNSSNKLINGAEFKIYGSETGDDEIAVVKVNDNLYRRAAGSASGDQIVVKDGNVRIEGFDNGTYYLDEKVSPTGYNKMSTRQKFIISDGNLDAVFNEGIYSTGSGVHVVNKSGTMLPETGGMGTTIFLLIGGIAVLGAAVALFARRRASQYE